VKKIPLHISRIENQVFIEDSGLDEPGIGGNDGGTQASARSARQQSSQQHTYIQTCSRDRFIFLKCLIQICRVKTRSTGKKLKYFLPILGGGKTPQILSAFSRQITNLFM
jgi:hypothetical protein